MTDKEIEAFRKRLNDLTGQCLNEKQEQQMRPILKELAREVGASTTTSFVNINSGIESARAATSELTHNIHEALQTASMVNMCRTATQGYEMATEASEQASKQFRIIAGIAFLSAVAAFISAAAAWAAV